MERGKEGPSDPTHLEKTRTENERTRGKQQGTPGEKGQELAEIQQPPPLNLHNHVDSVKSSLSFSRARSIALVVTVTGAAFINTLSVQSTVIILPTIGKDLNIPDSRLQWVVSSYNLTFGCFLLLWGRIADIYGKKFIFVAGSVWVAVVAAVNPFMPNEIAFDTFRGLHGLGAAANVPTAIGIIGVTFPPGKARNYAFSSYAAGAPLGSIFGNMLSGIVAQYASWKWIFGVLAILAGITAVAGILIVPSSSPSTGSPREARSKAASIDWIGAVLITIGLVILQFALVEGNVVGWSTPWIPSLIAASFVIIAAFVLWQRYLETKTARPPLIKVSIFGNWQFSAVMVIGVFFYASFNNYLVFTTYFFQDYQGLSPLQTMLRFIPTGVMGILTILVVAQLLARVPTLFILIIGNVANGVASLLFAVPIPPTTSYFARALWSLALSVVGADTTWPALSLYTSAALPQADQAIGGALINALGQFGRAIGLAVSTAIQTAVMADARGLNVEQSGGVLPWDGPSLKGLRAANYANFAFGLVSLAIVMFAFRNLEIIGKSDDSKPIAPASGGGEEGIMSEVNMVPSR